jgi:hypothetical protein
MSSLSLAAAIAATLGAYTIYTLLKILYQEYASPLRNVPGPKSDHWFLGNRQQLFKNVLFLSFSRYPPVYDVFLD